MAINDLKKVQNLVYTLEHDQLNDYLKGVKDMICLLNNEINEENKSPVDNIQNEVLRIVKKVYNM